MQEKAIYLSALYLFLPSCCHLVPREENALSHSLYLLVVGLMWKSQSGPLDADDGKLIIGEWASWGF